LGANGTRLVGSNISAKLMLLADDFFGNQAQGLLACQPAENARSRAF